MVLPFRGPKRVGHATAWSKEGRWYSSSALGWPLRLWERAFYARRPDLVSQKATNVEWALIESKWRFIQALLCYIGPPCHILANCLPCLTMVMLVAVGTATYVTVQHEWAPFLPSLERGAHLAALFRITGFALSLLLVVRVRSVFDRWFQAVQALFQSGTAAVEVVQRMGAWGDVRCQDVVMRWVVVYMCAAGQGVRQAAGLPAAALALLSPAEQDAFQRHGGTAALARIRVAIASAGLEPMQVLSVEESLSRMYCRFRGALLLKSFPMPRGLEQLTFGFSLVWLLLMPFELVEEEKYNGFPWGRTVGILLAALLLLGADEVATQLEDPWSYIPVDAIVSDVRRYCEIALESAREARDAAAVEHPIYADPLKDTESNAGLGSCMWDGGAVDGHQPRAAAGVGTGLAHARSLSGTTARSLSLASARA